MVSLEITPRGGGDTITITDDAIASINPVRTHTALSDFRITLKGDRRLEDAAKRQDRINLKDSNGDTKFTGYLTNCEQQVASGNTQISGQGIAKKLKETRPDIQNLPNGTVTYDNVFVGDAIEDYWSRTPFNTVTVTKQTGSVVVSDSLTQSADTTSEWNNALSSIPANTPLFVENGSLKIAQTGFVQEAETASGAANNISRSDFSDGAGVTFNQQANKIRITISLDYEVSGSDLTFSARTVKTDGTDSTAMNVFQGGSRVSGDISPSSTLDWYSTTLDGGPYGPGDVTFTLQPNQELTFGGVEIDIISVTDNNYTYTFDNSVDEPNGHLDGPELYATDANPVVTTNPTEVTRNIAEATVDIVANDTSNDQRLGLSDDGGANFQRADNTSSLTDNFTDAGRQLVTEFRLSGITGTAQNATPRFNYEGQEIDSFETKVDLDDRVVYVDKEVGQNHFKNQQTLHEDGDFVFVIDHSSDAIADMQVFSFPRGEETRSYDITNEIDETPTVDGATFYNTIPLQGGLDSNGNRPFVEVKNQDSINEIGEEISPGLLRNPTISSDTEAQFIAQALLDRALKNGQLRGTKTVPATLDPLPGFAYSVSWLDDDPTQLTLEKISLQKGTDAAEATMDFTGDSGFTRDVNELRRQAREQSDKI